MRRKCHEFQPQKPPILSNSYSTTTTDTKMNALIASHWQGHIVFMQNLHPYRTIPDDPFCNISYTLQLPYPSAFE